ncbi:MFS general substrate transporter [Sanghuangporus baumii]|uniref:MFS general substrate transporter n=1 Tax=Sanghuangporus baumii TaxID=108892 RepID=A0A9Q5HTF6_SANBA|nr:MFS general substrate transporter [Sanghuangporus baumii]
MSGETEQIDATAASTTVEAVAVTEQRPRGSFTRSKSDAGDSKISKVKEEIVVTQDAEALNEKTEDNTTSPKSRAVIWKARMQLFSLCFTLFLAGWDSGAIGPLIPRFQIFYDVNFAVVSLIFIMNAVDAQSNSFVAALSENSSTKMGIIHALYGFGAVCSPFAATQFAQLPQHWSFHFIISLGLAAVNTIILVLVFKGKDIDGFGAVCSPFAATQFAQLPQHWSFHFIISLGLATVNTIILVLVFKGKDIDDSLIEIGERPTVQGTSEHSKYRQILGQKIVHLLALFSLVYVGVEFTIGGWTVSYIQKYRGGGASSGYISTGFFGGLTVGRVALLWVNQKVGEHLIIYIYTLLALGLQLITWLVPNLIADAVAVSLAGVVLGPMYPILMNETGRLVPQWLHTGSIAWIASFGFAGSALFPFITGALAQRFGIEPNWSTGSSFFWRFFLCCGSWFLTGVVDSAMRLQPVECILVDFKNNSVRSAKHQAPERLACRSRANPGLDPDGSVAVYLSDARLLQVA